MDDLKSKFFDFTYIGLKLALGAITFHLQTYTFTICPTFKQTSAINMAQHYQPQMSSQPWPSQISTSTLWQAYASTTASAPPSLSPKPLKCSSGPTSNQSNKPSTCGATPPVQPTLFPTLLEYLAQHPEGAQEEIPEPDFVKKEENNNPILSFETGTTQSSGSIILEKDQSRESILELSAMWKKLENANQMELDTLTYLECKAAAGDREVWKPENMRNIARNMVLSSNLLNNLIEKTMAATARKGKANKKKAACAKARKARASKAAYARARRYTNIAS